MVFCQPNKLKTKSNRENMEKAALKETKNK